MNDTFSPPRDTIKSMASKALALSAPDNRNLSCPEKRKILPLNKSISFSVRTQVGLGLVKSKFNSYKTDSSAL